MTGQSSPSVYDNVPLSSWIQEQKTRKNLLSPLPQQTTLLERSPSPLQLVSPSLATQHDIDNEETTGNNEH